ncbi:MAG: YihY/virulence factor BrkB family protein [Vicinamibacterales bacterium]
MLWYFESTLSWKELLRRTYKETVADNGLGLAAQLAYYFLLALFPTVLCVIALASFLPLQNFTDEVASLFGRIAPPEMVTLIREQMARLANGNDGGIFSIGLAGALWSSSAAMVAMIDAMNRAYDIEESRPWWKARITAVLLTVGLAVFVVVSAGLIVAGPQVADLLASSFGFGALFTTTWKILQWPIAFALVTTGIALVYYYAPDAEQDFTWITPGSVLAAALWVIASLGFRFYVVSFGNYEATYGTVTGVILLMLWFYISGLMLIIGAEAAAEIEHASPWGKAPGEKVPGERKKIGSAAGRAFRERKPVRSPAMETAPVALPVFREVAPARSGLSWFERVAGAVLVVLMWRKRTRS